MVLAHSALTARMCPARSSGNRARMPSASFGPCTTIRNERTKMVTVAATPVAAVLISPARGPQPSEERADPAFVLLEIVIPVSYVVLARRDVRVVQICSPTAPRVWHLHDLAAVNPRRIRTLLAMGLPRPAAG